MRYLIEYFIRFRSFVGRRVYYLLGIMLIVGFLEGIGVMLLLPILENGFGDDRLSQILRAIFDFFGINYSFTLVLIFILAFFILRAICLLSYAWYFGKVSADLVVRLRCKIVNAVFASDYLYILKKELGYFNNAMVREIGRVVDAFDKFSTTLNYVVYGLIYAALAMLLDFKVVTIVIALSPIFILAMRKLNSMTTQASLARSFLHGKFNSVLIQALSKFKYLKATLSHVKISKIIDNKNRKLGSLQFKLFFLQSLTRNAFEPVIVLVVIGILFHYVVVLGRGVNEVIFLSFLFLQIARQFLNAQSTYRKFLASMGSIETFNNLERELEKNKETFNLEGVHPDFNEGITLKNVTVIFPNGKKALDDVSIYIKPKSVVAFVGHSGSGKSTVANMITGLLKPTNGKMLFGNVGYDRINVKALRENIGYVTQEDIIFNASIKENISLWEEDIDENKLAKVIEMAHIRGFVNDLPGKHDSKLGDDGLDISGGQRQRITIARELYKNAKLLILDEATSSLDSKSEKQIYENLKEFKGKTTMVVIAHRLSTIKNADYIYVLEAGKVVEEGTYEKLYGQKGEFTNMVKEQALT